MCIMLHETYAVFGEDCVERMQPPDKLVKPVPLVRTKARKERKKATTKAWREANKDHIKKRGKVYYAANKDRFKKDRKAYYKAWAAANNDHKKAWNQAWYAENKDQRKAKTKAWNAANKDRRKATTKAWNAANKDLTKAYRYLYVKSKKGCVECKDWIESENLREKHIVVSRTNFLTTKRFTRRSAQKTW
jgi:hypothetical protein